jgi:hypothetical protein
MSSKVWDGGGGGSGVVTASKIVLCRQYLLVVTKGVSSKCAYVQAELLTAEVLGVCAWWFGMNVACHRHARILVKLGPLVRVLASHGSMIDRKYEELL